MKSILVTLASIVALTAALPGDYGSSSTTTPATKCTPTTYFSTSTGCSNYPGTICTTETSALTLYGTSYSTSIGDATSTYVTTIYKTVESKVPTVVTKTKSFVTTIYTYETQTDYSTVKTNSPCPTTYTSTYHTSSVVPHPYTSTNYNYITKTITTTSKSCHSTVIPSTSTCKKDGEY